VFKYFGCTMAEAISCRPVTAVARVQFQISPCETCVGQRGTGKGLSSKYFAFPPSGTFYKYSVLTFIYTLLLAEEQTGEDWKLSIQQFCCGNREPLSSKCFQFFTTLA